MWCSAIKIIHIFTQYMLYGMVLWNKNLGRKSIQGISSQCLALLPLLNFSLLWLSIWNPTAVSTLLYITLEICSLDGLDDLLIGAPGYLEPGHKNQGCVFILTDITALETMPAFDVIGLPKICSEENNHYGRFGHSIATSKLSEAKNEGSVDFIGISIV